MNLDLLTKRAAYLLIVWLTFAMTEATAQYCDPVYTTGTGAGDYIDGVVLEDINNVGSGPSTSGIVGYSDFTDLSTLLTPGLTYTIELINNPTWSQTYTAWIDYNGNEVFEDDEVIANASLAAGASTEVDFTVSVTALPGETRMRVRCIYPSGLATPLDPCASDTYGETEDYTIIFPASGDYDIGVTDITSVASGCGLGLQEVSVEIYNLGLEDVSSFSVAYVVDNPVLGLLAPVIESYTGPTLSSLESTIFTFSALADFSEFGDYTVTAYTIYDLDESAINDSSDVSFVAIPSITSFPYVQDFEGGAAGWISGGSGSTWELGYPAASIIDGPPPGTPDSENSWATNLFDFYGITEDSWVQSPCFDFSDLVIPYVKFDIWWQTGDFWDGARMEYSLDAGDTWLPLGGIGTGDNWYTGECFAFDFDPATGFYNPAWEGAGGSWKTAEHDLSFLAGESQVQLRIHLATAGFIGFADGIAFDNFFVGDPFDNDLGVVALVDPSSSPSLSASETVTVEIENFGVNPQSGFTVAYQMDGGAVVSETFAGTINGGETALHTFATTEDLSVDGDYTFVAWTALGSDEDLSNDTLTKVVSNLLPISGTDGYYIYSNTYGGPEPWFTTSGVETMDAVYGPGEWNLDFFETVDPDELFSTSTCFIWLEGGDAMAVEMENFLNANMEAIENWVASGGHLFMNAAPNEDDGMSFGFDGVNLFYPYFTSNAIPADPSHPIFDGPFTPVGSFWSGFSFGHATITGDADPIIVDEFDETRVVLAEKNWGAGNVMFGGMTPFAFHSPLTEATNLRYNIVSYLAACTLADIDAGVATIIEPNDGCGLETATVIAKVRNYGFDPASDIPVNLQVDGGTIVTEIVPGTLDPGESVDYTFTALADLSTLGEHTILVWTTLAGDTIFGNDTADAVITNIPVISTFPYAEDFEDGPEGWTTGGINSTWELGFPSASIIDGAPPTTPSSENSWATNLNDFYDLTEDSWLQSPCFDFTDLVLPFVRFDIWWETPDFWDGVRLEYSTDAGASWDPIGGIGTGDNWYTDGGCFAFDFDPAGGTWFPAWEGSGGGWVTAQHDITFLAGETQVQFRFHMATSGFIGFADGVAIDNFYVSDPFPNDVGVVDIVTPFSAPDLSATESVTIEIENFGTLPQSGFPVSYQLDGGAIVTETFTGTVDPGLTAEYTFSATADLSDDGDYEICSWTALAGDDDLSNDSICQTISNLLPVTGDDAYYIYSDVYGGAEAWFTTTNSEAMDEAFPDGWELGFFEDVDPATVFSSATCFVWLEGSDGHAQELEDFLDDNIVLIEGWVASGGKLFLNSAPNEGDGMDFGFDDTELIYAYFTSTAEAYDDSHPILAGPFTPVGTSWTGGSFGHARISGDFDTILVDQFSPSNVVLSEKSFGAGRVVFGGMTTTNFHSPLDEAFNLRANILAYLSECAVAPVDMAMVELLSPESGCGLGVEAVTVEIENLSGIAVSDVDVSFSVDGGAVITETITDVIDASSTYTYTFLATADLSAAGPHTIETSVSIPGDIDGSNDDLTTSVTTLETPVVTLPANGTFCDELELDAGNPGSTYLWSTGATSQEIIVTSSGTYSVTVTNPTTGCSASDDIVVNMEFSPVASFTYTATGLTVNFTNTSTGGASYSWNFGDGATSAETNPVHVYGALGVYNVTLTVSNGCGSDFYSATISVANSIEDILAGSTSVYPNPTSGKTVVSMDFEAVYNVRMEVVNSLGQIVWSAIPGSIQNDTWELDLAPYADGVYTLRVYAGESQFSKPIILNK